MRGVNPHFQCLQPITFNQTLERKCMSIGRNKAIKLGKGRRLAFAQVRKNNTATLNHGVRTLLNMLVHGAAFGLGRRFQTGTFYVEQPTMERAAQTTIFNTSKCQIGTAVRAIAIHKAQFAVFVAEQNEILSH